MSERKYHSHQGRIFWGLILVVIGGLFLLDRLGGFDFGYLISTYWPVIIMILGLSILIGNRFRRPFGGLFIIALGGFFLLRQLDLLGDNAWDYVWPALIILVGLSLLLRPASTCPASSGA